MFTDTEIDAIKTYVLSGHGIIATSGTFDTWTAPNNQKLAELFGMNSAVGIIGDSTENKSRQMEHSNCRRHATTDFGVIYLIHI